MEAAVTAVVREVAVMAEEAVVEVAVAEGEEVGSAEVVRG